MSSARSALVNESADASDRTFPDQTDERFRRRLSQSSGSVAPGQDQPSTTGKAARLYADHDKVYSRSVHGAFRKLKWATLWVLLGLYYIGPWIRWDRGPDAPDQALLIDMPGRRAYFFWIEIWPQEVYYLTGLLILGAIGLFLATAWFGRVWCGFTCPQTVWTDLFMWVERKIEGDRNARMRLDKAPLSRDKLAQKSLKHLAWLLIAFATGGIWILYFNDAPSTVAAFFTGEAGLGVYGFTFLFTMTTYVLAGWAREQVCIYMCPWPRFQSAMFDEDSLIVTYEEWRGEPRGGARKDQSFEGRGHCVDCGLCWQVCPTGVDIRKGQQMACIGCALCIDACNSVMDKFGLPQNLITYDSVANQVAREHNQPTRWRFFRPRTIAYMVMLIIVATIMVVSLTGRSRLEVNVQHDRSPLYVRLSDGSIRNGYTFKILNMEREDKVYTLAVSGVDGAEMTVIGVADEGVEAVSLTARPDDVETYRVFVTAPRSSLDGASSDLEFTLSDVATGETVRYNTVFAGPRP